MGLAAPKNRSKISNDPQNTNWANNTARFGHRILESQGWKAGDSLGAQDAAHAAHYTAASQSHIRVFLKDDNLGLGAKRGSERAENFGLAGLESILGRLNGREEDVKKEEARREEVEKRAYVYRKYGLMNFVSGGFLVGDKIQTKDELKKETEAKVKVEVKSEPESDEAESKKDKKRKRKEREEAQAVVDGAEDEPKLKRKKKSVDLREASKDEVDAKSGSKKEKKDKKDKKKSKKSKTSSTSDPEPSTSDAPSPQSDPEPLTDKARRKAEKKVRKEEKKLKKALKKAAKEASKSDSSSDSSDEETTPSTSTPATGTSTPTLSAAGLTFGARGMHAVRQRYIRQKKAASMDPQALKEIFMIKTPS